MEHTRRDVLRTVVGVSAVGVTGSTLVTTGAAADDCSQGLVEPESEGATATLWHPRRELGTVTLDDTERVFDRKYDHDLHPSEIPGAEMKVKLQSAIPAGGGPHLFQWTHDLAGRFESSGYLSDQGEDIRVEECQFAAPIWDAARYDGKTVGLPFAAETVALLYNKDLVEEPPETLGEMQSIMDDFHDPARGKFGLGLPINPYYLSGFAQAYGGEIYDGEADELGLTSDAVEKGLRVVFDELRPYMAIDPATSTQRDVFAYGDAPFLVDGPWQVGSFEDVDVGVTTLPTLPDGGTPRPYMGVKLLYFTEKVANHPTEGAAAREFAEWYATNESRLLTLAEEAGYIPVHTDLAGDSRLPTQVAGFSRQVQTGYPMPANPKMDWVWEPFEEAVVAAFNGRSDLETLLAEAETKVRAAWNDEPPASPTIVLPGQQAAATDLDGDGLLEDVDGDGDGDVFDAITYYNNRDSEDVQEFPSLFDFDGEGDVGTVFDAIELYNDIA